jgi:hypothetical protein
MNHCLEDWELKEISSSCATMRSASMLWVVPFGWLRRYFYAIHHHHPVPYLPLPPFFPFLFPLLSSLFPNRFYHVNLNVQRLHAQIQIQHIHIMSRLVNHTHTYIQDLERSAMVKLDPNSGNTTFASSDSLDIEPLSSELFKASASTAFWRTIKPGVLVDCQDSKRGHWLKSKIVEVDDLGQCLVHFLGWAMKWDEWYPIDSEHIAKAGTYTDQTAPVVDEIIPLQDEKAILKATAFRVKDSVRKRKLKKKDEDKKRE